MGLSVRAFSGHASCLLLWDAPLAADLDRVDAARLDEAVDAELADIQGFCQFAWGFHRQAVHTVNSIDCQ